jgi:predicted phage-related endonuclease
MRMTGIGGSDAKDIMEGNWHSLWLQKTGRQDPEDLSGNLAVQMGTFTEPLNIFWFEKHTGHMVLDNGASVVHPTLSWMRCNLDGRTVFPDALFEAKHVSAFSKDEEIVQRYYPQLQHCMAVTGLTMAFLSVFFGNSKWAFFDIKADPAYQQTLIEKEAEFWQHVVDDVEPSDGDSTKVKVSFETLKTVSFDGNNMWASHAADWLANKDAAKKFEDAAKAIKEMIEPDVGTATGYNIKATRNKAGSLSIKGTGK